MDINDQIREVKRQLTDPNISQYRKRDLLKYLKRLQKARMIHDGKGNSGTEPRE